MAEKQHTAEEIQKLVPRYKGKPENFNPAKAGKKPPAKSPASKGPASPNPTPPDNLHRNVNPTPQRTESMLSDSIFGVDVSIVPIAPRQEFSSNYCAVPIVAAEIFSQLQVDQKHIDRELAREELSYYATGMLWLKLIDVKAKLQREALSSEEKAIRKAVEDIEFNVPQPLALYLSQIGKVADKMGKVTDLHVPHLPTTAVGPLGGYHAAEINQQSHNLFEEVPCLGIAGDMVMALTQDGNEPEVDFHIGIPQGSNRNKSQMSRN